jgi:hypothetical protein
VSDLNTLQVVLTTLGSGGILAGLGVLVERVMRSRTRAKVYGWSMRDGLTPAQQKYALELVSRVDGGKPAEFPVEAIKRQVPRPRAKKPSALAQLPVGPRALPADIKPEAAKSPSTTSS